MRVTLVAGVKAGITITAQTSSRVACPGHRLGVVAHVHRDHVGGTLRRGQQSKAVSGAPLLESARDLSVSSFSQTSAPTSRLMASLWTAGVRFTLRAMRSAAAWTS